MASNKEVFTTVHTRNNKVDKFYDQIIVELDKASDAYELKDYTTAFIHYQTTRSLVIQTLSFCEKHNKRTYIPKLRDLKRSTTYDLGQCLRHQGDNHGCIPYYLESYQDGYDSALDQLIAAYLRVDDFEKTIKYSEIGKKYLTFPPNIVYNLAIYLRSGRNGVTKNLELAITFFQSILKRGFTEATVDDQLSPGTISETLAQIYCELKKTKLELEWRLKAVHCNNAVAQHNYAEMLKNGEGVQRNFPEAMKYHLLSAQGGHSDAMNTVGNLYWQSDEVSPDLVQAEYWYRKAIETNGNYRSHYGLAVLIYTHHRHDAQKMAELEHHLSIAEKNNSLEAKSLRGCMLLEEARRTGAPIDEAMDMFQELALQGLGAAQCNLATLLYQRDVQNASVVVYWYLEAIRNECIEAKDNLLRVMMKLAEDMSDRPEELLSLFEKVTSQYRQTLSNNKRKPGKDIYLSVLTRLTEELTKGLEGNFSEMFKHYFPSLSIKFHDEINPINRQITRAARQRELDTASKIRAILEFTLSSSKSMRNKTCALRTIGEIVNSSRDGYEALIANQNAFLQLAVEIENGTMDNEGFMELCIGLAKLRFHPSSKLIAPCFASMLNYFTKNLSLKKLTMTPYQASMLLSAISDLAPSNELVNKLIAPTAMMTANVIEQLNSWQLFKCLQAICVIDACPELDKNIHNLLQTLIEKLLIQIIALNPAMQKSMDMYQLYLCIKYIEAKRIADTKPVMTAYKAAFSEMLGWLRDQPKNIPTQSQKRLADFIRQFRNDVMLERFHNGLFADIFLSDCKVVIEFDGPHHFLRCLPDEILQIMRRARDYFHDAIIGFRIARICYFDFDPICNNHQEMLEFLRKNLLPMGVKLGEVEAREVVCLADNSAEVILK